MEGAVGYVRCSTLGLASKSNVKQMLRNFAHKRAKMLIICEMQKVVQKVPEKFLKKDLEVSKK